MILDFEIVESFPRMLLESTGAHCPPLKKYFL
jgi:hypothetical protein